MTQRKLLSVAAIVVAASIAAGCSRSDSDMAQSTNSASGLGSATNALNNNMPPAGATNGLMSTNDMGTNLPAAPQK